MDENPQRAITFIYYLSQVRFTGAEFAVKGFLAALILALGLPAPSAAYFLERSQAWLLEQPPDNYTVQIFAATDAKRVDDLVSGSGLGRHVAVVRVDKEPLAYYKGMYKSFSNRPDARRAADELEGVLPYGPFWVRRIGDVVREVKGDRRTDPIRTISTVTKSEDFQQGQAAFNGQDYATALSIWSPLAQQGLAEAQYAVAFMYESGWGVEKSYAQAFVWYSRSALQDYAKAQFNLGRLYKEGRGIERNPLLGEYWIRASARGQDPRALNYVESATHRQP